MHAPLLLTFYIGIGGTDFSLFGARKIISEALGGVYGKYTLTQTQGMWNDKIEHGFRAEIVLLDGDHTLALTQAKRVAGVLASRLGQEQIIVTSQPLFAAVLVTNDASVYEGASNFSEFD